MPLKNESGGFVAGFLCRLVKKLSDSFQLNGRKEGQRENMMQIIQPVLCWSMGRYRRKLVVVSKLHRMVKMDENDCEQGDLHLFVLACQSSGLAQDLVSSRRPEQGKQDSGEANRAISMQDQTAKAFLLPQVSRRLALW